MKLLFTDLDATLLNSQKSISNELRDGLNAMLANGHKLILASGRHFKSILAVQEQLGIHSEGLYISACNGSLLYDCTAKTFLQSEVVLREDALDIIEIALAHGIHIQAYNETSIVSPHHTKELDYYTARIPLPTLVHNPVSEVLDSDVPKLVAIDLENKENLIKFKELVAEKVGSRVTTLFSSEFYLELFSSNAGKGKSVTLLRDHLHLTDEDTYAVGDAENDLSMLLAAGTACAVANATDEIKSASDCILTRTNNEDGVLELLERFGFLEA